MSWIVVLDPHFSIGDLLKVGGIIFLAFAQLVTMTILSILALIKKKFGAALIIYWVLFVIAAFCMLTFNFDAQTGTETKMRYGALYLSMIYFFVYLAIVIKEKTKNKNVTRPPKFKA